MYTGILINIYSLLFFMEIFVIAYIKLVPINILVIREKDKYYINYHILITYNSALFVSTLILNSFVKNHSLRRLTEYFSINILMGFKI